MSTIDYYTKDIRDRLGENSGLGNTIKFDFKGDGFIFVDGKSVPNIVNNDDARADCTVVISLKDFNKLVDGTLKPTRALLLGKLKVKGNMLVARKLGPVLGAEVE